MPFAAILEIKTCAVHDDSTLPHLFNERELLTKIYNNLSRKQKMPTTKRYRGQQRHSSTNDGTNKPWKQKGRAMAHSFQNLPPPPLQQNQQRNVNVSLTL